MQRTIVQRNMSVRTSIEPIESIESGGDVISYLLDSDGMNYGSFVDVPNGIQRDRGRNDWYEAHLVDDTGSGVIRYIELERSEDTSSFSDLKQHLKRHGSPIDELFTVIAYRNGEDPLTSPVDDDLTFLFIDEQFSSEDVEVTFDLKYFTVKRFGVEPAYVDFLGDLSVDSGQGRTSLEREVKNVFSIREITQSFYEEFGEIFRETLQDAIHNLEDPDENLNAYTRTVVNRVLFLMFIEEKGWLDGDVDYIENQYEAAKEDPDKHLYHDLFEPLFFEALSNTGTTDDDFLGRIPFLNGGLFERAEIESDVIIDEAFFDTLLDPEEDESGDPKGFLRRYKISLRESNPSEQELVVDPEFIGRIFEMFMQEDERSEVGAFYTPKPITAYMTKNALKQHLLARTDLAHEQVVSLVSDHTAPESLTEEQAEAVDDALRSASVLDPAVGSGAFIIAMLEELVAIAEAVDDARDDPDATDRFERKEEFIADNLYGVDIDAGGIELCKFRVWLHLMQDLNVSHEEFLDRNEELALPNLGFKFFVGNSLVGEHDPTRIDVGSYQETLTGGLESTLDEIHETRSEFLTAHGDEKDDLGERLEDLTDQLETQLAVKGGDDWMNEVADEAGSTFAWTSMIPEVILDGGFDIVIGNPPYRGGRDSPGYVNQLGRFYDEKYDFYKRIPRMQYDLYQKFIVRAWELARDGGIVSYITSGTFLTLESKETSRWVLQENELHQLVLANDDTFDAAVEPAIFSFTKEPTEDDSHFFYIDGRSKEIESYRELVELDPRSVGSGDQVVEIEPDHVYRVNVSLYSESFHRVFFKPTELNLGLSRAVLTGAKDLSEKWEYTLRSTTRIRNREEQLNEHAESLEAGDVTLFGLGCRGGRGLNTGNNNNFLAYINGTEKSEEIKQKYPDFEYAIKNAESDDLKRGELSTVITDDHVADVSEMTEEERLNGISEDTDATWVPIEKGFSKGEEYYKDSITYIDWSAESVAAIENSDSGLIRNPDLNFSSGLFFVVGGHANLRTRYTNDRVIVSGNLFRPRESGYLSPKYLLGIVNSDICVYIYENFINESGVSTTYLRFIPVPVPTEAERKQVEGLVEEIIDAKEKDNTGAVSKLQEDLNEYIAPLYGVDSLEQL